MSDYIRGAWTESHTCFTRKYLSDPTEDVRIATENLLAEFLREIRDITLVQRHHEEDQRAKREAEQAEQQAKRSEADNKEKLPDITMAHTERATFIPEHDDASSFDNDSSDEPLEEKEPEPESRDLGSMFVLFMAVTSLICHAATY